MKPADLPREILYPFTDLSVLLTMIGFLLLGMLANAAGILGLWLGLIILPAFFRYALVILDARSRGIKAPAADIELFSWVTNSWSLFPLVLLCFYVWSAIYLASNVSVLAALAVGILILFIFPASMAVLSVTRSPFQSMNPVTLTAMIRACGWDYAYILVTMAVLVLVLGFVINPLFPSQLTQFLEIYAYFLIYSLTGAVIETKGIVFDVSIPDSVDATDDEQRERLTADRHNVVTHAYGFISRGNREGGLAHIQSYINAEPDKEEVSNWFFNEMLKWENTDAALFFAQGHLHRLLLNQRDAAALKLLSQCFHANPRFRPAADDRDDALELAARHGREDLVKLLA